MTEIYDLLRVLYAHLGTAYCPETGEKIQHISKEFVVDKIFEIANQEKIQVLAPLLFTAKEDFLSMLDKLASQGYLRVRLNRITYEIDEPIPFEKHRKNELYLVIDRLIVDSKNRARLFDAIEKGTTHSNEIIVARESQDHYFNLSFAVVSTGQSYPNITPQTLSFNHDAGMCEECQGLGLTYGAHLSSNKAVLRLSLMDLLTRLLKEKGTQLAYQTIQAYFRHHQINCYLPLKELSSSALLLIFNGGPAISHSTFGQLSWLGIHTLFGHAMKMGMQETKEALLPYMQTSTCPSCQGARLNPLARNIKIGALLPISHTDASKSGQWELAIHEFCHLDLEKALLFMKQLSLKNNSFLKETHNQIIKYLQFLISIGVSYLSCDRSAPTLSGGELQRIRLARQLGSGLTSCLYILDEPTIGLHPHNNQLLNSALKQLVEIGNTLILVEHDPMTLQIADHIVDFGPQAGQLGGKITAQGTLEEILNNQNSLTGAYLSGRKEIALPKKRRPFSADIRIENGSLHNLKHISLSLPKGAITCFTGVSGSGKSTLMRHILKPAAELAVASRKKLEPVEYLGASIWGLSEFERVISIDQSPIGQTARADLSTYTEVMPLIRAHFAALPASAMKGLQPRNFSPNHLKGMCRTCWGLGYQTMDLQFLPSVRVICKTCHGHRLNGISLEVKYKGKHVGDILKMSVAEALVWFEAIPKIVKKLQTIQAVGLSYLQLGQEIASLSGGEAQRLRLSRELSKREVGTTLYLIDEPTTGLHTDDIAKLVLIFQQLAAKKNTLLIIEHNLDIIAQADHVIDLGPDAGEMGGQIMAEGTPEEISLSNTSRTAPYLKSYLSKKQRFKNK